VRQRQHAVAVNVGRGKATMQVGKLLQLIDELGTQLTVEVPETIASTLEKIEMKRSEEGQH
jgi:hypothetical protein